MQGIKVAVKTVGAHLDITLITVLGYVDTTTCHELTKLIEELLEQKNVQIIADLGGVTYISSAGWGVFVGEIKNIRDSGGDLKIVQMTPEVLEVFEMLEFNKILNTYDTIEEAINEFDIIRGIDISQLKESKKEKPRTATPYHRSTLSTEVRKGTPEAYSMKPHVSLKDLPLLEKVKRVVVENPFWGSGAIRRRLRSEKYGSVRVGGFRMYSILRQLNLETKEKRYRFYRSR
jgi:anti-sigma B factor antagonist